MSVQVNGETYSEESFEQAAAIVSNSSAGIVPRTEIAKHLGQMYDGDRDIYEVLGYDNEVTAGQYRAKYKRQDIAKRIIELPAKDTWRHQPEIQDDDNKKNETDFEDAVETLEEDMQLFHYCMRTDITAGIGEYGILFLGFADSQPLDEEVNAGALDGTEDLEFMTPFAQDHVVNWTLGKDDGLEPTDERYNKPVTYEINFSDNLENPDDEDIEEVHWTRLIHVAEDRVESDLKGTPRLRAVYNRLEDLQKVVGASAEMFWTGADKKYQFNIDTDDTQSIDPNALDDMDEEVEKLVHEMQNYVKTFNTDINELGGEEVDPSGVVDQLIKFISGATGIPQRILTGSERGELASSQDKATWFGQVETRQNNFAEPIVLRPILDRLQKFNILPEPQGGSYSVEWPNLFELTEVEQADVQKTRAQTLKAVAPKGNTDLLGDTDDLLEYVITGDVPESVKERIESESSVNEMDPEVTDQFQQQFGSDADGSQEGDNE